MTTALAFVQAFAIFLGWFVLALALGLIVGKVIRLGEPEFDPQDRERLGVDYPAAHSYLDAKRKEREDLATAAAWRQHIAEMQARERRVREQREVWAKRDAA